MANKKPRQGISATVHTLLDPIYNAKRAARIGLAGAWRRRNKTTTFIGITGSHGKSTATAMLGAILNAAAPTKVGVVFNHAKSAASTVFSTSPSKHRYCVQEVSGFPLNSIDLAFRVLQPQIGLVTAVGGDHRKEFRSFEETAAEKSKMVRYLAPDGLAVLNLDDPLVAAMAKDCVCRVIGYGRTDGADLRLLEATSTWPDRLRMDVVYRGERFAVGTQLVGTHWYVSVMAALLTALELGIPRETCLAAIAAHPPLHNKMSVHSAPGGAWYVLDAAKLSYYGMEACLSFLKDAKASRRSVLLGTISDHPGSDRPHYERVARLALAAADRVVVTGPNALRVRRLASEFGDRLHVFESRPEAARFLTQDLLPEEVLYIKAPQGDRLPRLFSLPAY
jgi:UDP-N-acetylmuramoyl-tripeptide--D-alanyl-D-alanine ligase